MTPTAKAQWQIHFCVILWGFTAILGKLITLQALALVWWRMLIVVVALALVPTVWRGLRAMPLRLIAAYAGIGCLVALHWLTFYGAIKLANASVAATCMGVGPAFLALVEPWLTRKRFDARELALGVLVIPGVVLVAGGVPVSMHLGLGIGMAARTIRIGPIRFAEIGAARASVRDHQLEPGDDRAASSWIAAAIKSTARWPSALIFGTSWRTFDSNAVTCLRSSALSVSGLRLTDRAPRCISMIWYGALLRSNCSAAAVSVIS